MTDIEMTKLCAEAMGLETDTRKTFRDYQECLTRAQPGEVWSYYDPLNNDAEAMALVKRFWLVIGNAREQWCVNDPEMEFTSLSSELNRAIVECVALIQVAKCEHEWVDARNEVITSGEMCRKCLAVRSTEAVSSAGLSDKEISK